VVDYLEKPPVTAGFIQRSKRLRAFQSTDVN